ncbi:uncharacterized protein BJ212DRAFT_1361914 [Suillus subaureus]|uniref:Uncharacterized protein n=1 Tax=Suillus subaureus TaxID=48587 RepID=A0A9P7JCM3_9AGAM|nr:uncharacterized protein BJ212DRAFT_1361914 [Suillus subaureus]KAG1814747.1 hypothetical protein BJ212DRAFT_1361914 [Suillus subaureus]
MAHKCRRYKLHTLVYCHYYMFLGLPALPVRTTSDLLDGLRITMYHVIHHSSCLTLAVSWANWVPHLIVVLIIHFICL